MIYPVQLPLADLLWAKTLNDFETKELIGWLPLPVHLRDTAEIACLLLRHRKSRQQLAVLDAAIPKAIDLEALVWLLAALHDTGKAGRTSRHSHKTVHRASTIRLHVWRLTVLQP